ncbi:aminotransferase class I/II-fold pyridoxal phosphate-dependent enzyme [Gordonia sp. ABSL11-1]|uniref:aminotransferase class I/II-fold pyridoxal phosphate-dependent enzyme n=1 Tax=Gordonia sp. ABSL11-1 TaxID=3053924 RepID=UPI0033659F6D
MTSAPMAPELSALRRRTSVKWWSHPDDVLPMFVAEMDFALAPVVADAMVAQTRTSDVGYCNGPGQVGEAFRGFADRQWAWAVDPRRRPPDDRCERGDRRGTARGHRARRPGHHHPTRVPAVLRADPRGRWRLVEVPLLCRSPGDWSLDLTGIEDALRAGARAVLLCHPHNAPGPVHPREDLAAVAELAAAHDAVVVSDEIHAPLVHHLEPTFVPFPSVRDAAREVGIAAPRRPSPAVTTGGAAPPGGVVPRLARPARTRARRRPGRRDPRTRTPRAALHSRPAFGEQGRGFARVTVGCAPELVEQGVQRIVDTVHALGR